VWELLSFMQGKVRRETLASLENGPKTPSRIAEESGENLSHISRALKELATRNLVECMTPQQSKNRIYRITDKGHRVLNELDKL
jgi:predicted transcriptional regulator